MERKAGFVSADGEVEFEVMEVPVNLDRPDFMIYLTTKQRSEAFDGYRYANLGSASNDAKRYAEDW